MSMLTAEQAASRLGIKVESVYAYVSRGLIERHRSDDGRTSRFDSAAVERLARRGRPRLSSRRTSLNMLIETEITEIESHHIRYRGHDAVDLATTHSFEQVAELLWTGQLPPAAERWAATRIDASSAVPAGTTLDAADSIRITAACLAVRDPFRADLDQAAVAAAGRHLIASMVESLPRRDGVRAPGLTLSGGAPRRGSIAGRLWAALAPGRPRAAMVEALNAALVLLADHELAVSTFAVRVAASARANPYAMVAAGLGVLEGPLHGGASRVVHQLLTETLERGAPAAIANALRTFGRVPGFGQFLYPDGDPRAVLLLRMLRDVPGAGRILAAADSLIDACSSRAEHTGAQHPNVDFALAVLGRAAQMREDSGEAMFAVARTAGWLAHGLEELSAAPLRFRPRASYVRPSS